MGDNPRLTRPLNASMTPRQAPEIFQIPLDDLDPAGLPPRGTPEFEQAVIGRYALDYAARGWQAVVVVDDAFVRVVAVPERGVEPKAYVLGLLQNGFLEDALPVLEALDGMLDDAELAYSHGLCLSELGRPAEAVAPLQRGGRQRRSPRCSGRSNSTPRTRTRSSRSG